MVNIEGMIKFQPISIFIDSGAILSYISPRIVELCKLVQEIFYKLWSVQLATCTKCKVTGYVKNRELMDWIEKQSVMVIFFNKTFTCIDDTGNTIKQKGIPRKFMIREIYSLQMKRLVRKGYKVFVFY